MQTNRLSLNKAGRMDILALMAQALALKPPGSDGIEFRDMRTRSAQAAATSDRRSPFERLDRWLWSLQQQEIETYLAKAADVYGVEARIRALERNAPRRCA